MTKFFPFLKILTVLLSVAVFCFGASSGKAENPVQPTVLDGSISLSKYKLVWSDDFPGTQLDTSKWDYRTGSAWWSTQLPGNVSVADGTLRIALKKESVNGMKYTGGGVISKKLFKYGFYEARMKTPRTGGWHSSFWMMKYRGSPKGPNVSCQELDVIENDSVHPNSYSVNVHRYLGKHVQLGTKTITTPSLWESFHVYGCEFTPKTVRFYFDGKLVQTVDVSTFKHGDQNIWLTSLACSLGHTTAVDETALPQTVEFRNVRYFAAP